MSYVDTSVIVVALEPSDPRSRKARQSLDLTQTKIVSELVLAELANVIGRRQQTLSRIISTLGKSWPITTTAIILYILKRFNLKYISTKGYIRLHFGEYYKPLGYSISLAGKLKLKTLDLLHLSYIKAMKNLGIQINTLLTADTDFIKNKEDIQETIGVIIRPII
ncbi:MAG: PIN domain-containing protein [Desulfurococcales archaeon]|nr:PIN domain-containing protein [Desulfurococcales archaeon]